MGTSVTTQTPPDPNGGTKPDTATLAFRLCGKLGSAAKSDSVTYWGPYADCLRRVRVIGGLSREGARLAEIHWTIPEYHDEQRFRDGLLSFPGPIVFPTFGPVAYVYAVPQLHGYRSVNQIQAQGQRGALVAIVVVEDSTENPLPQSYTRLNLSKGMNCVWLAHAGPDLDKSWSGYIAPAGTDGTLCDRSRPATRMDVYRSKTPGAEISDYPAVARFGESTVTIQGANLAGTTTPDRKAIQATIGVKCLDGWCDMGPEGFAEPAELPAELEKELSAANARLIKGYRDEQWLGVADNAGILRPSVRALIAPVRGIDMKSGASFEQEYDRVALIYLFDSPPVGSKYARWGLVSGVNYLELKRSGTSWAARIVRPGATPKAWKIIDRVAHHDEAVPGTARFRWTEEDDGIWIPCDQACCQAQGGS